MARQIRTKKGKDKLMSARFVIEQHGKLWSWSVTAKGEQLRSGRLYSTPADALENAQLHVATVLWRKNPPSPSLSLEYS